MSRFYSHLTSAVLILSKYRGEEPFASYLKKYFASNKKFGSKDRKQVAQLCYAALRLGKSDIDLASEDRILTGVFLTTESSSPILHELKSDWDDLISRPINEKLKFADLDLKSIF